MTQSEESVKLLSEKQFDIDDGYHPTEKVCYSDDVKEAVLEAEDFIISMKRDNDLQWNMRLNLIIEEFRNKIFGEFK